MTKLVKANPAVFVDQDKGRSSLHLIGAHGKRHALRRSFILVNADRKAQPVFICKYLERVPAHDFMMLKDSVQPDHSHLAGIKFLEYALSLRNACLYAAWAENLESMQHNHLAAQRSKRDRLGCV